MNQTTHQHKNELLVYRRRMGFSQKQVARLLGHRDTSMLSRYEHGHSLPPLLIALELEIIYRAPVAFLYVSLYKRLKEQIRSMEQPKPRQLTLF
jgi:transcriptional regulator with XRE-family HTH domain